MEALFQRRTLEARGLLLLKIENSRKSCRFLIWKMRGLGQFIVSQPFPPCNSFVLKYFVYQTISIIMSFLKEPEAYKVVI